MGEDERTDLVGRTPFHWAAFSGDIDTLRVLKSKDLDTTAGDKHGDTPLHYAAQCGNHNIIEYLLSEAHADPRTENDYGKTAENVAGKAWGESRSKEDVANTVSLLQDAMARFEKYGAYNLPVEKKDDQDSLDDEDGEDARKRRQHQSKLKRLGVLKFKRRERSS
jgi:hypothetical protein